MKPFVLIAAAALLVTGCQSKKEICANWVAGDGYRIENAMEYQRKLGINNPAETKEGAERKVWSYCEYLKR